MIVLAGLKGGMGKTRSAVNLATVLAGGVNVDDLAAALIGARRAVDDAERQQLGRVAEALVEQAGPTALIDCDPLSQSAFDWHTYAYAQRNERMPFEVLPFATLDVADKVAALRASGRYRHFVIDTGGGAEAMLEAAVVAVGRYGEDDPGELLIPSRPDLGELRRIPPTLQTAAKMRALAGAVVYPRVLLVDVPTNPRMPDERRAREFCAANGLPVMAARVRHSSTIGRQFGRLVVDPSDYADVAAELLLDLEQPDDVEQVPTSC